MRLDHDLLTRFETGLDPRWLERSSPPAQVVGFGEISAIFHINGDETVVYKRLPLFTTRTAADRYAGLHEEYCRLLIRAGLRLPESATAVVAVPRRPFVLYIAQQTLPASRFGHRLIHRLPEDGVAALLRRIIAQQQLIRTFNQTVGPDLKIAVDGQLSNWAVDDGDVDAGPIVFVDTSTPFIRRRGQHQLDTALLLRSVPVFIRPLLSGLLVKDILDRYFDLRRNLIDLVANLFKEQRPDLIPLAVAVINEVLAGEFQPLREREVASYYRTDKYIWAVFLTLRRLDRWVATRLLRRRYEFILPGDIRR